MAVLTATSRRLIAESFSRHASFSNSAKEALTNADQSFTKLTEQGIYDWGGNFVDKESIERWGKVRPAIDINSDLGIEMILYSIRGDFRLFKETMDEMLDLYLETIGKPLLSPTAYRRDMEELDMEEDDSQE